MTPSRLVSFRFASMSLRFAPDTRCELACRVRHTLIHPEESRFNRSAVSARPNRYFCDPDEATLIDARRPR
jgi:hypothetical protein